MAYRIMQWFSLLCSCLLFTTVQGQVSVVPAVKGQSVTLECELLVATNVKWTVLNAGQVDVEVSTCDPFSGVCRNQQPYQYEGQISISRGGYTSKLVIFRADAAETQFKCWAGNDLAADINLGFYVSPSAPSCSISWNFGQYSYIDLTCETDNVYPSFLATPLIRELDDFVIDWSASGCTVYEVGSGAYGDCYGNCTWRIPFSSLLEENTVYVEMVALVGNDTLAGSPVFSSEISALISLPSVIIYGRNCPVGPGVIGEYIKIDTVATCQCDLVPKGRLSGSVRWYTRDGDLVQTQDNYRQYSILRFSYNASDAYQAYDCRADNPTATYYHVPYTPKFSTSPPQSLISGLLFVMGISLALKFA